MTLESREIVYAEFAASNVKRFVLSVALLVDKGIGVTFSANGMTLTNPDGQLVRTKRQGSLLFLPKELAAPLEENETFRRAMEPFGQDEEERIPEHGVRVRPEDLLRAPDVREAGGGG